MADTSTKRLDFQNFLKWRTISKSIEIIISLRVLSITDSFSSKIIHRVPTFDTYQGLTRIDIKHNLSDALINSLVSLPNLKTLKFRPFINMAPTEIYSILTQLTNIRPPARDNTDLLIGLTNLTCIDLISPSMTSLSVLPNIDNLKTLRIYYPPHETPKGFSLVPLETQFTSLEKLDLVLNFESFDYDLVSLTLCTQLQSLHLADMLMGVQLSRTIVLHHNNLTSLDIRRVKLGITNTFNGMIHLTSLVCNSVINYGCDSLTNLTKLTTLKYKECTPFIAFPTSITNLKLNGSVKVSPDISLFTSLTTLRLKFYTIKIDDLASLPKLELFVMVHCHILNPELMPNITSLKRLYLCKCTYRTNSKFEKIEFTQDVRVVSTSYTTKRRHKNYHHETL